MKIIAPNKDYCGVSASVPFAGGVGHTNDPHLIEWFESHGYTVEHPAENSSTPEPESEPPAEDAPVHEPEKGKKAAK